MSGKVRVLVVDDSVYSRQTIKKMLESDPGIEVAATAANGVEAMTKTMRLRPDLITLDFEMPEMDGFTFLRWLMRERPTPTIMVSSFSDSKTVFKALELGAVDFIAKPTKRPSLDLRTLEKDIVRKALGIKGLKLDLLSNNLQLIRASQVSQDEAVRLKSRISAIAIGTSTGGPPALQIVLGKLPRDFPTGIIVSQHMPKGFTKTFAERLNKLSGIYVKEAEEGDTVKNGTALICPGGHHMTFRKRGGDVKVVLKESALKDKYVPSVDRMMLSAGEHFGNKMIGVVLTGMGNDGKEAMVKLSSKGCYTIAESEETAVVFGMPGEVIKAGAAKKVLSIQDISSEIIKRVTGERRSR
jgi:two-component system chemotaxis response regulator CheB